MNYKKIIFILSLLLISNSVFSASAMNQETLEQTIKNIAEKSKGEKGFVEFQYNNVKIYLISDVAHDRMRIISPITKFKNLSPTQLSAILESNFHKSLDARYAVSKDILYSAYIHPLAALNKKQIESAVLQVSNLALSFGSEYSSGVLSFGSEKKIDKKRNLEDAI